MNLKLDDSAATTAFIDEIARSCGWSREAAIDAMIRTMLAFQEFSSKSSFCPECGERVPYELDPVTKKIPAIKRRLETHYRMNPEKEKRPWRVQCSNTKPRKDDRVGEHSKEASMIFAARIAHAVKWYGGGNLL